MNVKHIFLLAFLAVVSFQLSLHTEDTPVLTAGTETPAAETPAATPAAGSNSTTSATEKKDHQP